MRFIDYSSFNMYPIPQQLLPYFITNEGEAKTILGLFILGNSVNKVFLNISRYLESLFV